MDTRHNEAIVFPAPSRALVEPCDTPEPGAGEVLIRTRTTLVSTGTELTTYLADYPSDSRWAQMFPFPVHPGYDNVGEVIAVGPGVPEAWLGRRVATLEPHARYVRAALSACRPIPNEVSDDQAAFCTIAEIVMNGVRRSRLTWGETCVVFGLGLLGQLTVRACLLAGASAVIGVDVAPARLRLLPDDSRVHRVDPRKSDAIEAVRTHTRTRMADVAFEVTGDPDLLVGQLGALREQGRMVVLSSPRGPTTLDLHDHCMYPSISIIGAHNRSHPEHATGESPWTPQRHADVFFDAVRDGALEVDRLVTHRHPYRNAPEVYAMLARDRSDAMGVLFEW